MRSVLDVDVGLPPGLWLPTADEPVDRFRSEVFNHSNHPYEDIVDFGVFATAMTALAANDKRPSFMPSQMILLELYTAGYGVQPKRVQRVYGGESRLQRALGFYPNRSKPGKEEIFERCRWMAEFVLPKVIEPNPALKTVHGILSWGTKRNLLPSTDVVRSAVNGDTTEIRRIFGIEKPDTLVLVTKRDLFKFGAKIIDENGGPLGQGPEPHHVPDEFVAVEAGVSNPDPVGGPLQPGSPAEEVRRLLLEGLEPGGLEALASVVGEGDEDFDLEHVSFLVIRGGARFARRPAFPANR